MISSNTLNKTTIPGSFLYCFAFYFSGGAEHFLVNDTQDLVLETSLSKNLNFQEKINTVTFKADTFDVSTPVSQRLNENSYFTYRAPILNSEILKLFFKENYTAAFFYIQKLRDSVVIVFEVHNLKPSKSSLDMDFITVSFTKDSLVDKPVSINTYASVEPSLENEDSDS